jgi:two-component system, cell cycle sensor histidine kinase and response regulator CckA
MKGTECVESPAASATNAATPDLSVFYEKLFEHSPDGVLLVAPDGAILRANPAACRAFGRSEDEIRRLGGEPLALLDPRLREITTAVVPIGAAAGSLVMFHDISERRRAEERIRESEALLHAITDSIPDSVFVKDRDSRWLFANPAVLRVIGKSAEEVLGKTDREIHGDPELGEALIDSDRRIMESGVADVLEETIQTPSGRRLYLTTKAPYRDLDGRILGVIGNARDITDRRRAEEQLHEAQKLESIGRLAGGVAHDFNNLLTVIMTCVEDLKEALAAGEPVNADDVDAVGAASERARELTRQLLAFARRQTVTPVPLDLNSVVHGTERLLRRVLGEHIELVASLQPELWPVRCDTGQMEQVILNLAVNARDAMPGGGKLTIESANVDIDESHLASRPSVRVGPCVRLSIRDSGQGMPPEVQAHVFEPFFTTKTKGHGTGLGLATVYGIVKQSGGSLHVESEVGRGTTFELYFPRIAGQAVARAPAPAVTASDGTETVLVVEDDPRVREVAVRSLRAGGYRVLAARDGRDALDVTARTPVPVDLLVTDVIMPGLSGRAVAEELRRGHPDLRVLYVSGYVDDAIGQNGVLDATIEFLPKPFTATSLLARVRAVLDAR